MPEFATEVGVIAYEIIEAQAPGPDTPTLTLLHNFMSSGRAAWGPLLEELSLHHRILLPDLPGHGASIGHPIHFDHHAIAYQLAPLLVSVGGGDAHLAGCSSGGMIAQILVNEGLLQPATLTLISTTYSLNPSMAGNGQKPLIPEDFRAARSWMDATARLHDSYHYEGYYEEVLLPAFRRLSANTAIDLTLSDLRDFTMPLCIIHGERDEFFPVEIPRRMAEMAPNAELHIVDGQSHSLLFRQPWQVARIMVEFLAKQTVH